MARTKKDFEVRRQQIIDGALAVFADKGFEKATNKAIAEAAGIGSPGLIYHYFEDKWDLFLQVLTERAPVVKLLSNQDTLMALPPREVFTYFARTVIDSFSNPQTGSLARMVLGEALRRPEVSQVVYQAISQRAVAFVERYIADQISLGHLRPVDVQAAARTVVGPIFFYVLTHDVFQFPDVQSLDAETMVQSAVDIVLQGLAVVATEEIV